MLFNCVCSSFRVSVIMVNVAQSDPERTGSTMRTTNQWLTGSPGPAIVTDVFKCRHLDLEMPGMFSSSTVILSVCLHYCHLLGFLPSFAGHNLQHNKEYAGDAEPCQFPSLMVSTNCRGNVTVTGLSWIICWRTDSWSSFHPFVLLIWHREQTKLPKWSCQRLPMIQELS